MVDNNKFDKELKRRLTEQTEIDQELKERTWNQINNELFVTKIYKHTSKRRRRITTGLSTAAVIAILIFGFMTDTGQAMIQSLKDMFVEEKQEEIEIEGHKEQRDVNLQTNEELRYIIYVDEERYRVVEGEDGDRIETIEPLGDKYPEVYMEITRKEHTTTEAVIAGIKESIVNEGMEVTREERASTPIDAELIQGMGEEYENEFGKTGHQWDTKVHKYYVTDTEEGQVFIIKQAYFLEAAEGHGARFDYMLESFEVVK
ncbi:hypothetical protein QGM71_11265 [Virgibacillus sp. C22-A2]|uniref:DUF4367 domain-containing protein n=1 Tax=Virgibacillus tibetensis TaxID=3042313 RepID=A0ABU6KFW9_9BACI|nr:hypothetical protein [Virgibacillus sp. C22-A2]